MKSLAISLTCTLSAIPTLANAIKMAHPGWSEGVLLTQLAAAVLEQHMGYTVELTLAEPEAIYDSVAAGEQDVYLDAWLPFTHASYWKQHSFNMERLGTVIERTRIGLAVPTYVEVKDINQLNDYRGLFDGKIIGIELDAGITTMTNRAIREYELNFTQVNSSTDVMTAALDQAIAAREPIVITGWTPHWMFARYDLKMLLDTKQIYQPDGIRKFARLGFGNELPDANRFLKRFALTEYQLNALLLEVHDSNKTPKEVAQKWMLEHPKTIEAWIAPEKKWWQRVF